LGVVLQFYNAPYDIFHMAAHFFAFFFKPIFQWANAVFYY